MATAADNATKHTITSQPCHVQGGPHPQPYFLAGNHIRFSVFFIMVDGVTDLPAPMDADSGNLGARVMLVSKTFLITAVEQKQNWQAQTANKK